MWWSECEEAACIDGRRLEDLFFRVYDATSRRQYQYPVGFTAEHDLFQDMPNCAWLRFIQPDVNTIDPSAVARHITGRWTGDRHREKMDFGYDLIDLGSDQEEQSKWISTTTSFDWAFYEMARRLARRSKYGHVIDHVSFATIDAGEPRPGYRGIQHIRNSKHVAQRLREIRDDSPELQLHLSDRYARAIRFADASSEWLYYGRIFDKSIYSIHHSTREVSSLVVWIRKLQVVAIGDRQASILGAVLKNLASVYLSIQSARETLFQAKQRTICWTDVVPATDFRPSGGLVRRGGTQV